MQVVAGESEIKSLRQIAQAIDDKQADLAALKAAQHPPLPLSQAWAVFLQSTERRQCGDSTLRDYEGKWLAFQSWMERDNPPLTTLQEVSGDVLQAYLESLNRGKLPTPLSTATSTSCVMCFGS